MLLKFGLVLFVSLTMTACGGGSGSIGSSSGNNAANTGAGSAAGGGGGSGGSPGPGASACDSLPDSNPWPARRIINISHRGGASEFPENTIYAYDQSLVVGADLLEMDIYETADGELVVIHDATVDRTTNGTGSVSDLTLTELKALDAAFWFVPGRGAVMDGAESDYTFRGIATGEVPPPPGFSANDFRIPTLREILERYPNELINIELKPDPDSTGSYEAKLAELLIEFGRNTDVMVASFVDPPAAIFKAVAPCVSTSVPTAQAAVGVITAQGPSPGITATHQAYQVPPSLGVEIVNEDFVNDVHNQGLAVHVFTINDCNEMVRLLNLNVDGIMTDRPTLLQALLDQPEGSWSCAGL